MRRYDKELFKTFKSTGLMAIYVELLDLPATRILEMYSEHIRSEYSEATERAYELCRAVLLMAYTAAAGREKASSAVGGGTYMDNKVNDLDQKGTVE